MTTVWLIRHGESAANAGNRTGTVDGIQLTDKGHEQAAIVAGLLPLTPDLIVTSSYLRTQETSNPTKAKFPAARQEIWPIHEFTYLDTQKYQNTTFEERKPFTTAYWNKNDIDYRDSACTETFSEFIGRVRDFADRLTNSKEDFVVVFGHGLFMHALEVVIKEPQLDTTQLMRRMNELRIQPMPNTHIMRAQNDNGSLTFIDDHKKNITKPSFKP